MTDLSPGGIGACAPGRSSAVTAFAMPLHHILAAALDRDRLEAGIARRRQLLGELEHRIVVDCESAAARAAPASARLDNRQTWTTPMWDRYVAAAAMLDPAIARRTHRLSDEILQLRRLLDLLGTPDHQSDARTAPIMGGTHAAA
jgi:hypothetical protein